MKTRLRKKYKNLRFNIPIETRENHAENIFKLISTRFKLAGKNISIFLPIKKFNEVNTWHLINNIDANYYLPVVKDKELKHIKFENKAQLQLSKWGIEEPTYGDETLPDKFDFVIVPLLAYDKNGNRIGYGAGFYDNFLKYCQPNCKFIGVSFFEPEHELIDTYSTDIAIHYCATPKEILKF
jgi:5-formyltetrahydrofolate cyclo-ligase